MSNEEQLSKLAKDIRVVKTWWPIATGICVIVIFFMGLQSLYDNKVAKKDDVEKVSIQIMKISEQLSELKIQVNDFKQDVKQLRDSLKLAFSIRKRYAGRYTDFVIERKMPNGKTILIPVNN